MTANLKANLLALCESADLLWSEYIQVGPGKMSPSAGDRFAADAAAVENSVAFFFLYGARRGLGRRLASRHSGSWRTASSLCRTSGRALVRDR